MKNFSNVSSLNVAKFHNFDIESDDTISFIENKIYAVFDGVTSPLVTPGIKCSTGKFASSYASKYAALYALQVNKSDYSSLGLLEYINVNLRREISGLNVALGDAATTAAVVLEGEDFLHFLIIGDSGVRINGEELIRQHKLIDRIYTTARVELILDRLKNKSSLESFPDIELSARGAIFNGIGDDYIFGEILQNMNHFITDLNSIGVMSDDIRFLLRNGIVGAQKKFANKIHPLGYAVLNGCEISGPDFLIFKRRRADIFSLELFTDGYIEPGSEVSVDSWEAMWNFIENEDPFKIKGYPHVKCGLPGENRDDRALLIVK